VLYFAVDVPLALFLVDAWRWARRSLRDATGALARGLRLASASLAQMITGMLPMLLSNAFGADKATWPAASPARCPARRHWP
jgi:hypothetical protein